MRKLERLVEELYKRRHQRQLDTVLPVVADEGMGKSTLIMQLAAAYCLARDGEPPTAEELLDRICYDRAGFQQMMAESDKQSLIMVPDAARILYSMDTLKSEQKQIEKDLMDVRGLEYFILLGFQSWDRIGGEIKERRSKLTIRIPRRGLARVYGRDAMDERIDDGSWPSSTMTDKFPSLEGTDFWAEYQRLDEERKRERLTGDTDPDPEVTEKRVQRKVALKAVRPWSPNHGMSYREAAKLIDYSKDWVGETVRDWKDGYYQDLVDKPEEETAGGRAHA